MWRALGTETNCPILFGFSGALKLWMEQEREAQFSSQRCGLHPQVQPGMDSCIFLKGAEGHTVLQLRGGLHPLSCKVPPASLLTSLKW